MVTFPVDPARQADLLPHIVFTKGGAIMRAVGVHRGNRLQKIGKISRKDMRWHQPPRGPKRHRWPNINSSPTLPA
ncbi:hypothetical protein C725_0308 [Pacificimonas flava]|uniref:Uncharacterized protein n=1 Tax=Pacificimonas flava TaxID=1234595 RepID=M2U8S0_9SPHN|nr:hypothetical protein C725_0308 [Pacificimonas flava]